MFKKLLIITDLFPDKFSPHSEVFVQQQVHELSKSYEVMVIATRFRHKRSIEFDAQDKYKVIYVYLPVIRYVFLSLFFSYRLFAMPVIEKTIKEWNPDLIHVHDFRNVPELLFLNSFLTKINILRYLTLHNIRTHPVMIRSILFKCFYRLWVRSSYSGWTHIFTVNDRIKNIISKDEGISNITNIGNAVGPVPEIESTALDSIRNQLPSQSFKIISVGNLITEKGHNYLIEAVRKLIRNGHDITVVIVGKGKEKDRLTSQINSQGLTKQVILTGDLRNEIVRNLYPLFDAFVLPSYSETFGIVYIEAMYAGLPVIGVQGQGIDGIIKHKVSGLLSKPKDVHDLVSNIEYLIRNKDLSDEMALKGEVLVKNEYQLTQLISKVKDVYAK